MKQIFCSFLIFTLILLSCPAAVCGQNQRDNEMSWSVFPFVIYNSDIGFGFGGKGIIKNYYDRQESFDLILFGSSKGEQWYVFTFSIPDFELRQGKKYPWSLDFKLEYSKVLKSNFFGIGNDTKDNDWQFPKEYTTAEIIAGRAFKPTWIAETGFVMSRTSVYDYEGVNPLMHPGIPGEGEGFWNYATFRTRYDSRDSQIDPTRGVRIFASSDFSFRATGSEASWQRYRVESSAYRTLLFPDFVLAARLWFQHVQGEAAYFQQSVLGGSWTLRGYKADRFVDKTYILASAEARVPIYGRLGGVLFVDSGRTFGGIDRIVLREYKTNTGLGLRFYLQNFLVRFDGGFSPEGTRIFFHFGHVF